MRRRASYSTGWRDCGRGGGAEREAREKTLYFEWLIKKRNGCVEQSLSRRGGEGGVTGITAWAARWLQAPFNNTSSYINSLNHGDSEMSSGSLEGPCKAWNAHQDTHLPIPPPIFLQAPPAPSRAVCHGVAQLIWVHWMAITSFRPSSLFGLGVMRTEAMGAASGRPLPSVIITWILFSTPRAAVFILGGLRPHDETHL